MTSTVRSRIYTLRKMNTFRRWRERTTSSLCEVCLALLLPHLPPSLLHRAGRRPSAPPCVQRDTCGGERSSRATVVGTGPGGPSRCPFAPPSQEAGVFGSEGTLSASPSDKPRTLLQLSFLNTLKPLVEPGGIQRFSPPSQSISCFQLFFVLETAEGDCGWV